MPIASAALAAAQNDFALTVLEHIGDNIAVGVFDDGADGDFDFDVVALFAKVFSDEVATKTTSPPLPPSPPSGPPLFTYFSV